MSISISLSASKSGSYNTSTGSSNIIVYIVASYDSGSFNRSAPLIVTVNGVQKSKTVSINPSESKESGSESIYYETWTIYHTSEITVYCHASLEAGGTTGTTISSDYVTLTVPNSGGDDSGGDDSGGEDDSGSITPPNTPHSVTLIEGEHTNIRAVNHLTGHEIQDGSKLSSGYGIIIYFDVDDGYRLTIHTLNGETIESGYSCSVYTNITIRSAAVRDPRESIDPSLASQVYKNCTGTGLIELYRSIVHGYTGEGGELSPTNKTNFEKNEYSISHSITLQYNFKKSTSQYSTESYSYYRVYSIAFTTPDTEFKISSLRFVYRITNISTLDSASDIKYSLALSTSNIYDYGNEKDDPASIASGTISRSTLNNTTTGVLNINTNKLKPNTDYYLVLYLTNMSTTSTNTAVLSYSNMLVGYVGGISYIKEDTEYKAYQCHIYTNQSDEYQSYAAYRYNGTGWDLLN